MSNKKLMAKNGREGLKVDQKTVERVRRQLPDKFLLAAAHFLQRALLQVDRAGPYHSALMSGIFHDHYLKASGKTPPGVQILINIPGMPTGPLAIGPPQGGEMDNDTPSGA